MIAFSIGAVLVGVLWYPLGYYVIDHIYYQPAWWIDYTLSYKNQECWLLIMFGLAGFARVLRLEK